MHGIKQVNQQQLLIGLCCVLLGVLGRALIAIPNVSPILSLAVLLGQRSGAWRGLICIGAILLLSDGLLTFWQGAVGWGDWSWFTYSGYSVIVVGAALLPRCQRIGFALVLISGAELLFWTWTNFGVWLTSGMYAHDMAGLGDCYIMALPFLSLSLLGDYVWSAIIYRLLFVNYNFIIRKKLLKEVISDETHSGSTF